jgi:hypothetical protein
VIGSAEVCLQEIIVNVGVFMQLSLYCKVCTTESYCSWTSFNTCSQYLFSRPLSSDGGSCNWTICTSRLVIKKSQLKYVKIIDNHIADKKCQWMTSICCNLWTTKETYHKLLWYRFYTNPANPFWIGFCQKLVFFQILIVIAHFWFT